MAKKLPRVELICKGCKIVFTRTTTEVKRTKVPFCTRDCYFKSAVKDRTRGGSVVDKKYAPPQLGTVFGLLTTVGEEYTFGPYAKHFVDVTCRCEKKETFRALVAGLYRGSITSCGCSRSRYPIAGQTYNKLTLTGHYRWKATNVGGRQMWFEVNCSCGSPAKYAIGTQVVRGALLSCGCMRIEVMKGKRIDDTECAKNTIWTNINRKKEKYGKITLTREQVWDITQGNCFYCGIPPCRIQKLQTREPVLVNGIDRVDAKGGYTPDNVVTCCWPCNRAKATLTSEEFLSLAERIVAHTKRKAIAKEIHTTT